MGVPQREHDSAYSGFAVLQCGQFIESKPPGTARMWGTSGDYPASDRPLQPLTRVACGGHSLHPIRAAQV